MTAPPVFAPPPGWPVLARDRVRRGHDLGFAVPVDHVPWGAVARRDAHGGLWRAVDAAGLAAEGAAQLAADGAGLAAHGAGVAGAGLALLHARRDGDDVELTVWAPPDSRWDADVAMPMARAWAGLDDDPAEAQGALLAHPVTRRLRALLGPPALSRMPSMQEAVGRGVLGQLVQFREAERSVAQLVRLAGSPCGPVRTWPAARRLLAINAWELRRHCGVSLRGAGALHAAAQADHRLAALAAERDWERLDRRLLSLPGIGAWTSAEARLALGDADAVPLGDWHLPSLVGRALGGADAEPAGGWTDAEMLELLEPFRPHRGRVIRMLMLGGIRGVGPRPARRGPRAALSAHRYW